MLALRLGLLLKAGLDVNRPPHPDGQGPAEPSSTTSRASQGRARPIVCRAGVESVGSHSERLADSSRAAAVKIMAALLQNSIFVSQMRVKIQMRCLNFGFSAPITFIQLHVRRQHDMSAFQACLSVCQCSVELWFKALPRGLDRAVSIASDLKRGAIILEGVRGRLLSSPSGWRELHQCLGGLLCALMQAPYI